VRAIPPDPTSTSSERKVTLEKDGKRWGRGREGERERGRAPTQRDLTLDPLGLSGCRLQQGCREWQAARHRLPTQACPPIGHVGMWKAQHVPLGVLNLLRGKVRFRRVRSLSISISPSLYPSIHPSLYIHLSIHPYVSLSPGPPRSLLTIVLTAGGPSLSIPL
jgi:hypothetical protein